MASMAALTAFHLIITRGLAAAVIIIVLEHKLFGRGVQTFPSTVEPPKLIWGRKLVEVEVFLFHLPQAGTIVEYETVAVRGKDEGYRQRLGIVQPLLQSITDRMSVVLPLDERDRDIGLVIEDDVGLLGVAAGDELPTNSDAALGDEDLFPDLQHHVPTRLLDGRQSYG